MSTKNSQDSSQDPPQDRSWGAPQEPPVRDTQLEVLREAATALRAHQAEVARARIPLEQVERELARVMHIELALLLVRACELLSTPEAGTVGSDGLVFAFQEEVRESIEVARTCGVRIPRPVLRLVTRDWSTWPCSSRLERWARRLDPDVDFVRRSRKTPASPETLASPETQCR